MRIWVLGLTASLAACSGGGEQTAGPSDGGAAQSLASGLDGPGPPFEWLGIDAAVQSPVCDASGRFVAFLTHAALDPADADTLADVYWMDRESGRLVLVSRGLQGGSAEGPCLDPALGPEGDTVAFVSFAANMTPALDTELGVDGMADVFVARIDVAEARVSRLTQASMPHPELMGATPNGHSFGPSLAAGGQRVAFWSFADNLARGDRNGDVADIFAVDLDPDRHATGESEPIQSRLLVSAHPTLADEAGPSGGASQWPSISSDGSTLAFTSKAWNLVEQDGNDILPDIFIARLTPLDAGPLKAKALERIAPEAQGQEALAGYVGSASAWSGTGRAALARDSSRVAFEVRLPQTGRGSVEVAQLDAGAPQVLGVAQSLADAAGEARLPQLSHDGVLLTVLSPVSDRAGHFALDLPLGSKPPTPWGEVEALSPPRSRDGSLASRLGFFTFTTAGPEGRSQRLAGRALKRP